MTEQTEAQRLADALEEKHEKEEFNNWWNSDDLLKDNPYRKYSPAYWAWEGWCAAVNAEREQCVKICCEHWLNGGNAMECADAIRARGQA